MYILLQERERLQAMMAHLHMTKDAVNNDQDKREGSLSSPEKKSVEPPTTERLVTTRSPPTWPSWGRTVRVPVPKSGCSSTRNWFRSLVADKSFGAIMECSGRRLGSGQRSATLTRSVMPTRQCLKCLSMTRTSFNVCDYFTKYDDHCIPWIFINIQWILI